MKNIGIFAIIIGDEEFNVYKIHTLKDKFVNTDD